MWVSILCYTYQPHKVQNVHKKQYNPEDLVYYECCPEYGAFPRIYSLSLFTLRNR